MAKAVALRKGHLTAELRRLATSGRHANQSRRLLSLAAALDGMTRREAARIGGMDRQTLRDWVHRFNERGPDGLKDHRANGSVPRPSPAQLWELATIVKTGPDRAVDGVVRWRRVDLKTVVEQRFGVVYHERTIGKLLKQIGFSMSARGRAIMARRPRRSRRSKKLRRDAEGPHRHLPKARLIEIWFQDEARIGQKNGVVRQWARRGTRPRQPADQRDQSA